MHKITELHCEHSEFQNEIKGRIPELEACGWMKTGPGDRKRVQIVGLGDVGQNVAIGLAMVGGESVEEIGIFDLNANMCRRMEHEIGQIYDASGAHQIPKCRILEEQELFDCDIFMYCATKAVPQVGSEVQDVRMAQYAANKEIISIYAKKASDKNYKGLFVVVSDPVDLLCGAVFRAAIANGNPLHPEQIIGCGLGVMHARATYYAKRDRKYELYLSEGRAFGPHGQDLILANSTHPDRYSDEISKELTGLTVRANLAVRELGFKPYIAPAMSSAVWTLLAVIEGRWNYSAGYLNGIFFGARNRIVDGKREWEDTELPRELFERISESYRHLEAIIWN